MSEEWPENGKKEDYRVPVETRHTLHEPDCSVWPVAVVVENLKSKPSATGEGRRIHAVPCHVPWA